MRRIYESDALERDDDEPFKPGKKEREYEPQSFRSLNASAWSDRIVPHTLRCRAISIHVSTPREEFEHDETVPFRVTMKNSLPIPVTIKTASPLLWTWSVDGLQEASYIPLQDPPDKNGTLHFKRGETKRFRKTWSGLFRVSEREWEPADPGVYDIQAEINVIDATDVDIIDETTVEIVP